MVDSGYMAWLCTIPPLKNGTSYKYIRFSEFLESMRKNIECTYGILKKRFNILKVGTRGRKVESCDNIFLTCCVLHNMLLFEDGLTNWETDERENNNPSLSEIYALNRLELPSNTRQFGTSNEVDSQCLEEKFTCKDHYNISRATVHGEQIVSKMKYETFYKLLVQHFDIRFKRHSIKWPQNMKIRPRNI